MITDCLKSDTKAPILFSTPILLEKTRNKGHVQWGKFLFSVYNTIRSHFELILPLFPSWF